MSKRNPIFYLSQVDIRSILTITITPQLMFFKIEMVHYSRSIMYKVLRIITGFLLLLIKSPIIIKCVVCYYDNNTIIIHKYESKKYEDRSYSFFGKSCMWTIHINQWGPFKNYKKKQTWQKIKVDSHIFSTRSGTKKKKKKANLKSIQFRWTQ